MQWLGVILELTLSLNYRDVPREITLSTPWAREEAKEPPRVTSSTLLLPQLSTPWRESQRVSLLAKVLHFQSRKRKINTVDSTGKNAQNKTEQGICFHYQKLNECKAISWLGRETHSPSSRIPHFTKQTRKLKFFMSMPW